MNINTLQKVLKSYVASTDCSDDERPEILQMIESCAATSERYDEKDIWDSSAHIIPTPAIIDMLNELTYVIYSKRAKAHDGRFPFTYYSHDCRNHGFDQLTDAVLELGYDVIGDLWASNEADGMHNEDGTFRKEVRPCQI